MPHPSLRSVLPRCDAARVRRACLGIASVMGSGSVRANAIARVTTVCTAQSIREEESNRDDGEHSCAFLGILAHLDLRGSALIESRRGAMRVALLRTEAAQATEGARWRSSSLAGAPAVRVIVSG